MSQNESKSDANLRNEQDPASTILVGIVRSLVSLPDQVNVSTLSNGEESLVTLEVGAEDLDKVTGAGGRVARSLQVVISALGKRDGKRFKLDIQPRNP